MADTRPITRLTIKDKETGTETETDVKTCARGVTCDEGKTAQDHISDFVAHKKDVNRHVLVQVGGDEPATGPALWFDEDNLLHYKDKSGSKDDLYPATKAALVEGLSALLTGVKQSAQTYLSSHTSDKNNPHGVTAEQAGADQKGAAAAVQSNLDTHTGNQNNPHNVTCDQIGAIKSSTLGKPNGPAKLDADGKLIKDQLPPVGGSRITITFEAVFQGATWTLSGGGENYSGVVDSTLKAVVPVMGVNTLYTVSAAVGGTTYTAEIATLDYFTALSLALTQFQATIIVTVDSGSTVTAVCGATILTKTSTGTAIFTVGKAGTWTITATKDGNTATGTVEITTSGQSKNLTLDYAAVFGVCWDTSNSSTALTRLTKTSDPYGFVTKDVTTEPVPAVGTGVGSSPFDNYAPWNGMKECNLSPNGLVDAWKGDSGFSRNNTQTMVFIPEFYVAQKRSGTKQYFYISDNPKTGFTKHPGSRKYVGKYHAANDYCRSMTKSSPWVNCTRTDFRKGVKNIGSTKFHLYDFATYCALIWLYIVEFADWDTQSKIGRGYVDSNNSAINSGETDSMTYHTGRGAGNDGSTAVQYRWIENLWGNVFQWVDGFNASGTTAYYCTDPSKYADDTTTGYTQIGTLPASGWIKDLTVTDNGLLIPKTVGGSETTFIPDYAYSSSGWRVLRVGGGWGSGSGAGLLCFSASSASSNSYSDVSARLLCEA
nr:MAG TPA_asm: tail collar fiber protein [Caudoviricetes sp.]